MPRSRPVTSQSDAILAPENAPSGLGQDSRYDRKLAEILQHATEVFHDKGYEGASMRDLSRATGMSLAGLYYYFESKEKLLYMVQKHAFETVLERLEDMLNGVTDPEERLRLLIRNHLEYFLANRKGIRVLSHEDQVLTGEYGEEIAAIKRRYYQITRELVQAVAETRGTHVNARVAALSLFGMMNWVYTWYRTEADEQPDDLAREMSDIFLHGLIGSDTMATVNELAKARSKRSSRV
jgi:AcrR family transcriptional regulator